MENFPGSWQWIVASVVAATATLWWVSLLYHKVPPSARRDAPGLKIQAVVAYWTGAASVLLLFSWMERAVEASAVPFDRTPFFNLGLQGGLLLLAALIWAQALFVWVHRLLSEVEAAGLNTRQRLVALGLGIALAVPLTYWLKLHLPWYVALLLLAIFMGLFDLFIERRVLNITWLAVWVVILSAGVAYGLTAASQKAVFKEEILAERYAQELELLPHQLASDESLTRLLSTPVPFTVKEDALRGEIVPYWQRLPYLGKYYALERILLVNPQLQQSVVEGRRFAEAKPWLKAKESSEGRNWCAFRDSSSGGYALFLPVADTLSGNEGFALFRPVSAKSGSLVAGFNFSLFSGAFILSIALLALWALVARTWRHGPLAGLAVLFDRPSLRYRIQLLLATFTLGAFFLTGWVSWTFFQKNGLMSGGALNDYFSALLNVYVFLLLAALAVAVAVGNSITRPLQTISLKLQALQLGRNEPLEWSGQDEIGELVAAYNRMITEVEKSAELLRRSEREEAWQEMARQVAHEIKNPLTPMKLSVQHLIRAYQNAPEQAALLVQRVGHTLLEQIDTLTRIAGEFSHFARLPEPELTWLDWRENVQAAVDLFQAGQEHPDVALELDMPAEPVWVHADRNQLTRVLNNLLKNALQAIPEDRAGLIRIQLSLLEGGKEALLMVKDNGQGIPADIQGKVFSPNFTTRSSGMGLGLAICKNMVEAAGGKIWFDTQTGEGTVFWVALPSATPPSLQ